jgi:DNA-binding NtrC family response regulator
MLDQRYLTAFIVTSNKQQGEKLKDELCNLFVNSPQLITSFSQAREKIAKLRPTIVFVDLTSSQDQGYALMQYIMKSLPRTLRIALISSQDKNMHVQALRCGAQSIISTPWHPEEVSLSISNLLSLHSVFPEASESDVNLRESDGFYGMVGNSPVMQNLFELILRLGEEATSTVLIQGESGVGKELVAKALHKSSPRANKNFVSVNCAAIPDNLLESELFGYEKGAFTGASQSKKGRLHYAQGGTLFLDEVGEMRPELQTKLLRVLEEREFEPVGSVKSTKVDTWIIAATNTDLKIAIEEGRFRQDLFYRLSVVPLEIPPLRDRIEDILLLIEKFTLMFNRGHADQRKSFSIPALKALQNYLWPGNVRELKNLVQRLCVLHPKRIIDLEDLPEDIRLEHDVHSQQYEVDEESDLNISKEQVLFTDQEIDFNSRVSEFEDRLILQALVATNGNKKQAAERLNLKRTTLLEKIKKKKLENRFLSFRSSSGKYDKIKT